MLLRISNSCTFSFDGKASLKKNKNLDKRENHSQILQSSTWSQKSQLYLCEMQLPESHMNPVVLDKCISFQFSHWRVREIFLSIWTWRHSQDSKYSHFSEGMHRSEQDTGGFIPTVTPCDVGQVELDLHLQVNWCNRNRSTRFYFIVGWWVLKTNWFTNSEMVCSSLQDQRLVQTSKTLLRVAKWS